MVLRSCAFKSVRLRLSCHESSSWDLERGEGMALDCLLFGFVYLGLLCCFLTPKVMCLIHNSNSISTLESFSSLDVHCDFLYVFLKLHCLK